MVNEFINCETGDVLRQGAEICTEVWVRVVNTDGRQLSGALVNASVEDDEGDNDPIFRGLPTDTDGWLRWTGFVQDQNNRGFLARLRNPDGSPIDNEQAGAWEAGISLGNVNKYTIRTESNEFSINDISVALSSPSTVPEVINDGDPVSLSAEVTNKNLMSFNFGLQFILLDLNGNFEDLVFASETFTIGANTTQEFGPFDSHFQVDEPVGGGSVRVDLIPITNIQNVIERGFRVNTGEESATAELDLENPNPVPVSVNFVVTVDGSTKTDKVVKLSPETVTTLRSTMDVPVPIGEQSNPTVCADATQLDPSLG